MTRIILVRHGETTWNVEGRYQGQEDTPCLLYTSQKILKKLEEKIHQNEFRKENISVWSIFCQGLVAKRCKASL